jgi:hypothetical protein
MDFGRQYRPMQMTLHARLFLMQMKRMLKVHNIEWQLLIIGQDKGRGLMFLMQYLGQAFLMSSFDYLF